MNLLRPGAEAGEVSLDETDHGRGAAIVFLRLADISRSPLKVYWGNNQSADPKFSIVLDDQKARSLLRQLEKISVENETDRKALTRLLQKLQDLIALR